MKRKLLTLGLCLATCLMTYAQKKPLDHTVYDGWKSIANTQMTSDGRYLLYEVNPQEGNGQLVVRRLSDGSELLLPRGYKANIATNNRTACVLIKAPYAEIRNARKRKVKKDKMPKDSLAIINFDEWTICKYERIKSYKTGIENNDVVAYIHSRKPNKNKKKAARERLDGDVLVVVNTLTGKQTEVKNVSEYAINADASSMTVLVNPDKKNKKLKSSATVYDLPTMTMSVLSQGKKYYGGARYSVDGSKIVFLASTDTITTGNKHCSLFYVNNGLSSEIIPQGYSRNLPSGWGLNENSAPEFSQDGQRVLIGVAPYIAPNDSSFIDVETAQVDIWNYKDYQIQPQQKVNVANAKRKTYLSVINLSDPNQIVPLTTAMWDRVTVMNQGNSEWALSQDKTKYYIQSQWDDDEFKDISLVNVNTGKRVSIAEKINAMAMSSPDGKYVLWYNLSDSAYFCYNVASGKTVNLTRQTGVNFYDETDDHPNFPPPYDTDPLWTNADQSVLISDRYDVWKFNPDGNGFQNLTNGNGRKSNIQLRHRVYDRHAPRLSKLWTNKDAVDENALLYMIAFDETTKKNGFATVRVNDNNSYRLNVLDTFSYVNVYKAGAADVMAYQKGNFSNAYNMHLSDAAFAQEKCVSDINPQMKQYSWGHAQLVHWKTYDGTPLDGLLYVPEGIEPGTKLPMMIYFYEKRSETLYNHIDPRPSRSTVNLAFYCSRGYVVFVPDIVYKVGHPGESAYNCIVSGAKAMCSQFNFIDSTRMAIQGQSWGGYQTAYLVTRTNMFCAAGAGAPVSNMTSAYGGIRWGSGVCRQMQYEHGQSRIGATLWDKGGLDLYLENSPLFGANRVETPLLIMHNDNDGAVPWYQGIEYFMALRRLGKPVWMLQYNREEHNLVERRNCKDLSIRLQQFFDHYMKGAPEPAWMKYGVPATRKGQYLGTELTE